MTIKNYKVIVSYWILLLVASVHTISYVLAKNNFGPMLKGTAKSIEVPEDGDIIDCVDIYKQPAFDHPLIKDLEVSLQRQSEYLVPVDFEQPNHPQYPKIYQTWHKYGECPKGTVPIRRTRKDDINQTQLHNVPYLTNREFARVVQSYGTYQGASAHIQIWNPKVERKEFSSAQLWIQGGSTSKMTNLEAGWIVNPIRYGDSKTRLFIHWTIDNYRTTSCFDLDCLGFIQIDTKIALGVPITPISRYNGSIFESIFSIFKDPDSGDWYFAFQNVVLGYWPKKLVPKLKDHAHTVLWGGDILNNRPNNKHTYTEMGSGHFSIEGDSRAAFMRLLKIRNNDYVYVDANHLKHWVWNSKCYNATIGMPLTTYRTHFHFGGPGLNPNCP